MLKASPTWHKGHSSTTPAFPFCLRASSPAHQALLPPGPESMAAPVPSTTHGDCPGSPPPFFPFVPCCSLAWPPQGGCSAQRVRAGDPNACSSHRFRPAALPQTQAACRARASLLPRSIRDAKPASRCPAWSAGGDRGQNGETPRCSSSKRAPTSSCVQTPCLQSSRQSNEIHKGFSFQIPSETICMLAFFCF